MIDVKPLHHSKQYSPNEVTEEGIVIEVKRLHSEKQDSPKEVTEEGMVIEVKLLEPEKQDFPNEVTLYSTPSLLLTFSGTSISPEYLSFVLATKVAVLAPVSNK